MKCSPVRTLLARCLLGLCLGTAAWVPAALAAGTATLDKSEQAFIAKATADNSMQIELAHVALNRSSSPKVRALAKRIIADHQALNLRFTKFSTAKKASGQSHGMTNHDVTEAKLRLQNLKGSALDKTFAGMMVKEHEKIIPLYERAARDKGNPKLQQIARQGLPLLREHLQMARPLSGD